ncbi:MAG: undecaprenyldiphospho-muramoylpentapeptide beta-N-acetylglucosaminyltransferase [Flavobacteriaceae bacterium]|nr:undecaprenyldiphospho-muramoylpentapeptide beta-N-acetylglucosaminyltransferase [Flavobacteriaceae bacterium]
MKKSSKISPKIILSGGGTGGHIYPAIAIANEIRMRMPKAEILFVGALDKMEMEKVPKAGYAIEGLWISGFRRDNLFKNINLPIKIANSLWKSNKILKSFKPDMVIGTGGFASGPIMYAAAQKGIPILLQEQNSFPGITNKLLKNKAFAVCTAYEGMDKYFSKEILHHTGNPIRAELFLNIPKRENAKEKLGFDKNKILILSVGGSLGARTLNNAWLNGVQKLIQNDIQILWQTGRLEWDKINSNQELKHKNIQITEFIYNMNEAYAAADIIVSRAGAMAISELTLIGKPTVLVPFPFAAEDHQTKNAQNLEQNKAAIMINDKDAAEKLVDRVIELAQNPIEQEALSHQIKTLAKPHATRDIVDIIEAKLNSAS